MGTLYYGTSAEPIEIDDHLLTHLKIVVTAKLRRNESFTLSWKHAADEPMGRSTIWLQSSIPLRFVFDAPVPDQLERELLHRLATEANSNAGVSLDLARDAASSATAEEAAPAEPAPAEPATASKHGSSHSSRVGESAGRARTRQPSLSRAS